MISVPVRDLSQVSEARRQAAALAEGAGFDEVDAGRVAIVATELASNLIKHGNGGEILAGAFDDDTGDGVELVAIDKGPGIHDLAQSLRDGHSTAGTPGNGLGAVRRQSQGCWIYSGPGLGTAVLARFGHGRSKPKGDEAMPNWGGICIAKPGEVSGGDCWAASSRSGAGHVLMVADGLGHGPAAAEASRAAARIFLKDAAEMPGSIVRSIHEGLRSTRGAAVAVARLDLARNMAVYAGIGNISAAIVAVSGVRRLVSHNGTAGQAAPRIREFEYPFPSKERPILVMHSDGIAGGWALDRYPGLAACHPSLVAAVIYRDFARGRDDATVVVARGDS